ncbi:MULTISPECIES: nucleoid-associated protein [Flavobacterium]|uniref:Nucleoid-associated protein NdpA n=2 Tax=Flavobacterium TaxID=237 RepID=A0A0A2LNX6_9FLAO|nr:MULTISPECIES: nucleoid-associated protein [Flavobacterium]KGO81987.1 nucleoid-associated protein NdpA [Flavobacterium beibuense F44-8]MEE1898922.1 nucleoid-associated protein [Flavobacterium rakeshii]MUV04070.1 nucleoid-associated protein [Flavobacterium rakeshii]
MINLFNTHIETLSVHRVGNKSRNEAIFLSEQPYNLNDEIAPLLKEYFFKPFREKEENYFQFAHEVDLDYHDMYNLVTEMFTNPSDAHEISKKITKHLFDQSNHPHIKNGEVYVTYLTNLSIDNNTVDAVGIFKSEIKTDFLQFEEKSSNLDIVLQQGINLNKLDKGCIVFNYKKEEGYKILTIDSNRYDARYWLEHFLSVDAFQDENFVTKKYLKFCQDFAKDVVLPAEDKKEEVMFMNRSVNYFAKNDEFEETAFLNEVIDNPDLIPEFKNYKVEKAPKYSIEDVTTFPIANSAVTDARKKIKNVINLDTNIQIKMDFVNPESAEKFVEKGWDEEKQMYYYLVYFNKEQKS